jgi:hypothetical protein
MKKTILGTTLLALASALPAGMAHAAGQSAPAGTQQVFDQEVFNKVDTLVQKATDNTAAVVNMDKTLKDAMTRKRDMGVLANTESLRNKVIKTTAMDEKVDQIAKQVEALRCAKYPAPQQKAICQEVELSSINLIKMLRENIENSEKRNTEIANLLKELGKVKDTNLTEALDLQTRVQTEMALLQNEKNMVDMAIVKNQQQIRLYNQLLVASRKDNPGDPVGTQFHIAN